MVIFERALMVINLLIDKEIKIKQEYYIMDLLFDYQSIETIINYTYTNL